MRLVCLSDTHGFHEQVEVPQGDVLIHAGDMSKRGRLEEIGPFLDWFAGVGEFRHRLLIAGNHDFAFEQKPQEAEALVPSNVIYLNDSGVTLDGVTFWGSPITPYFMNWAFNRHSPQIARHWDLIPEGLDVLVTHGPPKGVLDRVFPDDKEVGCPLLMNAVERVWPHVHVFGHIHECYGRVSRDGIQYINASTCDMNYHPGNPPVVVDFTPPALS